MREDFSVSATVEALQFPIPRTFCDELAVLKGDEMPILAWITRVTWVKDLAQQDKKSTNNSEMPGSQMKRIKILRPR